MIPITNDNIIRNEGVTAYNSKAVIIKHINTAKNDAIIIIRFLFFIFPGILMRRIDFYRYCAY